MKESEAQSQAWTLGFDVFQFCPELMAFNSSLLKENTVKLDIDHIAPRGWKCSFSTQFQNIIHSTSAKNW